MEMGYGRTQSEYGPVGWDCVYNSISWRLMLRKLFQLVS